MEKKNYYVECEEGASQYEAYDLTSQTIVPARYVKAKIKEDEGNLYIEALPYPRENKDIYRAYSRSFASIGDAIDKAFGNAQPVYALEIKKTMGLGNKAEKVRSFIELFGVGIIIFDEIQLIDFQHTKENSFDSLLTLANRTKVAIAVVGTEDARDKMFHELRTARRVGTMINGNRYCENREFFEYLVSQIFEYQWFKEPIEVTDKIIDALYDVTKGIIDQLVSIYSCMNIEAITARKKIEINADFIHHVADKYYPGIQDVLGSIECNADALELENIRKNADARISKLMDEAKQEQEMKKIKENSTAKPDVSLHNVASNIRTIYDDYTDNQIEEAYNKIIRKASSSGKSEKEITRLVVETLQKLPKKRVTKNKMSKPDIQHMRSVLGLENADDSNS